MATAQDPPSDWDYSGTLSWTLTTPFTVNPGFCDVTYSCATTSGPTGFADLCIAGTYNSETGSFSFTTSDKATYPPGLYEITITGTVGDTSDSTTFTFEIIDPCPTANLSLDTLPFPANTDYTLRDAQKNLLWSETSLLLKDTLVSCGTPTFVILNSDNSPIDT